MDGRKLSLSSGSFSIYSSSGALTSARAYWIIKASAQLKKMSGAESDFGFDMTVCSLF